MTAKKKGKPDHAHKYVPVAISKNPLIFGSSTAVLLRCQFYHDLKAKSLVGVWTLEQLRAGTA